MNSKAIKRQLLAAIAMVLVAAIALGSSTYAWFVASGTVEAYGMKVQAQSEGGLAISYGGTAWGTSATAGIEQAVRLYPTSTNNMAAWSHATAKAANEKDAVQDSRENITDTVMPGGTYKDGNGYVLMKEFQIRSTAKEENSLSQGLYVEEVTVKVGAGAAQKTMSTALRVGVRYVDSTNSGNSKSYIYGPVTVSSDGDQANHATDGYKFYSSKDDINGTTVTLATVGRGKSDILPSDFTITNDQSKPIKVQIYVWFEGEDNNLFSDNFNVEDLNVSVKFSSMGLVKDNV